MRDKEMKIAFSISFLILFGLSVETAAQASVETCFNKPITIFIESRDSTTSPALDKHLRLAKAKLADDEKIYIFVYSQGSWGTSGLRNVTTSVRNLAASVLLKKQFEVREGGYRNEAALDSFVLKSSCRSLVGEDYRGNPDMSGEQVDFSDAPLGLSVFPSNTDIDSLILKRTDGLCDFDWCQITGVQVFVPFFVIVDRDGKVLNSWFMGEYSVASGEYSEPKGKFAQKLVALARQTLADWAFRPVIKDGTARFVRVHVNVMVANSDILRLVESKRKREEAKPDLESMDN